MVISLFMHVSTDSWLIPLLCILLFPTHKTQYWWGNAVPQHHHIIKVLDGMWLHIVDPTGKASSCEKQIVQLPLPYLHSFSRKSTSPLSYLLSSKPSQNIALLMPDLNITRYSMFNKSGGGFVVVVL